MAVHLIWKESLIKTIWELSFNVALILLKDAYSLEGNLWPT